MSQDRETLLARKKELMARIEAIRRDLGSGLSRDSEDQAVQLANYDVLQEIHRLAQQELLSIERTLAAMPPES